MAKKEKSAYDAYTKERKTKASVRDRDVHNEQQMERSEIGEKKSMTSRIIILSLGCMLLATVLWVLFSVGQTMGAGFRGLLGDGGMTIVLNVESSNHVGTQTLGAAGFMTIAPGSSSSGSPSAKEFWDIARTDDHGEIQYADFVQRFFVTTADGESFVGRYNNIPYTRLDFWDLWTDVTYNWHWPAYCSLFDSTIESPTSYRDKDAADGRPEYVSSSGGSDGSGDVQGWISEAAGGSTGETGQAGQTGSEVGSEVNPGGSDPGASLNPEGYGDSGQYEPQVPGGQDVSVGSGDGQVTNPEGQGGSGSGGSGSGGSGSGSDDTDENIFVHYLKDIRAWKVFWTLFISAGAWLLGYLLMKKNLDAQNQLYDVGELNQYTNDQHIQFPQEMMEAYDWFPDVGAHCPVMVSSMLGHVMLRKKGLKSIEMAKRAEKDIKGPDGEVAYMKGEILLDEDGDPIVETVPIIDEGFADALYDSAKVIEDKKVRIRYDVTGVKYNPGDKDRDKLPGAETVADMINKYWHMPLYEPQRPAGAYICDTSPSNTMVLAINCQIS